MIVKKKAIYQYVLLYCLLLLNQSVASKAYGMVLYYSTLALAILIGIFRCPDVFSKKHIIFPICGLVLSILITRLTGGAIGLQFLIMVAADWIVASVAYEVDRKHIQVRYINLVCVMAGISLIGYISSLLFPDFTRSVLGLSYVQEQTFSEGIGWTNTTNWAYYGHWFFSFGRELYRNCGIYTEPGLYAIILVIAITMLLYCEGKIGFSAKKTFRRIVFLSIVLITAASATGFIMLILVFATKVLVGKKKKTDDIRRRLLRRLPSVLVVVVVASGIDLSIRGQDSLIYKYLLEKLLSLSFVGALETSGSTGNARLLTVLQGFATLVKYPFGAGTDRVMYMANQHFAAGCGLFYYLGVLGVLGWTAVVSAFAILWRRIQDKSLKWSLLMVYVIYGFSQVNFWAGTILLCALCGGRKQEENVI